MTFGTRRWWCCQPHTPAAFTPRMFLVLILTRGLVDPQGHGTVGRKYVTEKSSDTTGNRSRDLPTSSAATTQCNKPEFRTLHTTTRERTERKSESHNWLLVISIKMIKQLTSNTSYFIVCVRLHVSVLMWPSSGLLTNQVNKCWLHVGIPTMFTISTSILYLADKYIKFKG